MMMAELNRITSHLVWIATNGMDLGATSMMIYGFRERELILAFFEKTAGLRMNLNYVRPGGVAADLPDGWEDDVLVICDTIYERTFEYDELLTGQPIFRGRMVGVAPITAEEALALGVTGPVLRSTGVPWDLRRTMPYLAYDQVEFDVIVGTYGDNFDRYAIRLNEIRESVRIIRQCLERMPAGDYRSQDPKVTPPPRARIDESMEALIHHFKLYTEGFMVPAGRGLQRDRVAARRTRLLPRLRRRTQAVPDAHPRTELREPPGRAAHDARRPPSLTPSPSSPRSTRSWARWTGELTYANDLRQRAEELVALYPRKRSAMLPLLHIAQEQEGYLTDDGIAEVAELTGTTPADVRGTAAFYEMYHLAPVGTYVVSVCTNIACLMAGGLEMLEHASSTLGCAGRSHQRRRSLHPRRGRVPGRLQHRALCAGEPPLRAHHHTRVPLTRWSRNSRLVVATRHPESRHAHSRAT